MVTVTEEVVAPDDFDDEFEKAAVEGAAGAKVADESAVETPAVDAAAPKKDESGETPAAVVGEKKEVPAEGTVPGKEEPAVVVPSPADIALEALTKAQTQLAERTEAARVKKETDDKAAADAKVVSDAHAARVAPYVPNEAEAAAMVKFEKDFPQEYAAMQTRLKQERQAMSAEIYNVVQAGLAQIDKRIKPIEESVAAQTPLVHATAVEQAVNAITAAHKDYEAIHPQLKPWIDKLPAYKRAAVQAVYVSGSAQDVIDMITDFKKDTGLVEATPVVGTVVEQPKPKPKGASKEEIEAGAPVGSRRTAPKSGGGEPDKNDFDGAFEEAAGE